MEHLTLIQLVRKCLANDHKYITIDKNGVAYSSKKPPANKTAFVWYFGDQDFKILGEYKLTCNWKDAFIDVELLKGIH